MNAILLTLILFRDKPCNVVTLPHPVDIVTSGGGRHYQLAQIRNGRTGMRQIVFTFVEDGNESGFTSGVEQVYVHGNKIAASGRFWREGKWHVWSFRTDGHRIHLRRDGAFLSERVE